MMSSIKEKLKNKQDIPQNIDIEFNNQVFTHPIYLVESEENNTVLIAINPEIDKRTLIWSDGDYERSFSITSAYQTDERMAFSCKDQIFYFTPLNYQLYMDIVVPQLISPPTINSEEDFDVFISQYKN